MKTFLKNRYCFILATLTFALGACSDDTPTASTSTEVTNEELQINKEEAVKQLKEKGISEDSYNSSLRSAVNDGDAELVKLLLQAGATAKEADIYSTYPLVISAVMQNNPDILKLLLDFKSNPDIQNSIGQTPLMIAVKTGNNDMVELLIQAGADVNKQDIYGRTAYSYARGTENETALQRIQAAGGK